MRIGPRAQSKPTGDSYADGYCRTALIAALKANRSVGYQEDLARFSGRYVVLFDGDTPTHVAFFGSSGY